LKKASGGIDAPGVQRGLQTHVVAAHAWLPPSSGMIQRVSGNIPLHASMASLIGYSLVVAYSAAERLSWNGPLLAVEIGPTTCESMPSPPADRIGHARQTMAGDPKRDGKNSAERDEPFRRPADIGAAAVYLCSPAAKFVTGVISLSMVARALDSRIVVHDLEHQVASKGCPFELGKNASDETFFIAGAEARFARQKMRQTELPLPAMMEIFTLRHFFPKLFGDRLRRGNMCAVSSLTQKYFLDASGEPSCSFVAVTRRAARWTSELALPMAMLNPLSANIRTSLGISPMVAICAVGIPMSFDKSATTPPLLACGCVTSR